VAVCYLKIGDERTETLELLLVEVDVVARQVVEVAFTG